MLSGIIITLSQFLHSRIARFLISGCFNTAITYGAYFFLLQLMSYQWAYTMAYVLGIALAFALNRAYVFESHRGWFSLVVFPLIYVLQYFLGVGLLWGLVAVLGLSQVLAPLLVILLTVPVTYLMSRFVFLRRV